MVEFTLTAEPFLGEFYQEFNGITLKEITDISLMSIAQPQQGRIALQNAVLATWGCALPKPGISDGSKDGKFRLLCLGPDSFMAILGSETTAKDAALLLGGAGYCTDQSDNWVGLRIFGPKVRAALARICPINLSDDAFAVGAFARTSMEHLGVIILREGPDNFLLLSASSSASAFLHAIKTSIKYTEGPTRN